MTLNTIYAISDNRFSEKDIRKRKSIPSNEPSIILSGKLLERLINNENIEKEWYKLSEDYFNDYNSLLTLIEDKIYPEFPTSDPVKVEKGESGEDILVYNTNLMELGKIYEVDLNGERWALRKNEKTVEFLKFYPDKK